MADAVAQTSPGGFRTFCSLPAMFGRRSRRELTCVLAAVCLLSGWSVAEQQDFSEDFLKQEYSLAKPYRGESRRAAGRINQLTGGSLGGTGLTFNHKQALFVTVAQYFFLFLPHSDHFLV